MLYSMFCIFIGVTFANLGREEWNRARCETRFATHKREQLLKIKCTDSSRASASRQIEYGNENRLFMIIPSASRTFSRIITIKFLVIHRIRSTSIITTILIIRIRIQTRTNTIKNHIGRINSLTPRL